MATWERIGFNKNVKTVILVSDVGCYFENEHQQRPSSAKGAYFQRSDEPFGHMVTHACIIYILSPSLEPNTNRSHSIPTDLQVFIALRFYATGCFYSSTAAHHGITGNCTFNYI